MDGPPPDLPPAPDPAHTREQMRGVLHDLGERVKELTAMYGTARVLQREACPLADWLADIARLIPPAWQYPDVTEGRVRVGGLEAATPGFRLTPWVQRSEFVTGPEEAGSIEVVYLKQRPDEPGGEGPFLREERALIDGLAEMLRSAISRRRAHEALVRSNQQIHDLAGRLIAAQEVERTRIARELHDDLGQRLAAISIGLGTLKRHTNPDGLEELTRAQRHAADLAAEIRTLSHRLHPGALRHAGLVPALRASCGEFDGRDGVRVSFAAEEGLPAASPEVSICLFRIAQEALRNAVRHAGARRAVVALGRGDGSLRMSVRDDGKGFEMAAARASGGVGLASIEERVKLARGTLHIESRLRHGTELLVEIPLHASGEPAPCHDPG